MHPKNRVILITGGAHGIGRALAERFHAEGAKGIAIADLDLDAAQKVADTVGGLAIRTDVSSEDSVRAAVAQTEERLGPIDLLCSNAGILYSDAPGWMATSQANEQWDRLWKVNVMAHVWGARAVLPAMIRRGHGWLLQTVSAAGLLSQIGDAAYSTTKHAALAFAESLAITHGDQGIGVSVLCPMAVETAMLDSARGTEAEAAAQAASVGGVLSPEAVAEAALRGLEAEDFLIFPHPQVREYMARRGSDHGRWLSGMRRLRRQLFPTDDIMQLGAPSSNTQPSSEENS